MRRRMVFGLLVALVPLAGYADDAGSLIAMEQRWAHAAEQHDVDTIASMLATDFMNTDAEGKVQNREQYVAQQRASKTKIESEGLTDLRARVYGNVGVVTGAYAAKGVSNGQGFVRHGRFTDTWVRRNGEWKCVAGAEVTMVTQP